MVNPRFCAVLLIAAGLLTGCSGKTIKIFPNSDFTKKARSLREATLAEAERHRRVWRASEITDYDFEAGYQTMVGCTCPRAAVKVRGGKMVSMEKVQPDFPDAIREPERIETIEKLFDLIRQELDDDRIVEVRYNQKFGYPERIIITTSPNIDAKLFYEINKFEIIR